MSTGRLLRWPSTQCISAVRRAPPVQLRYSPSSSFSTSSSESPPPPPDDDTKPTSTSTSTSTLQTHDQDDSALARRFSALAEDALTASPSRASKLATDESAAAAISEELKEALAARVASADFSSTHAQSISLASLPTSAPKQARDIAAARAWTGEEALEDTVLRMLVDKHKPLRGGGGRRTTSAPAPAPVDMRPRSTLAPRRTGGQRVASAREQSLEYSLRKDAAAGGLSGEERDELKRMFRDRFEPTGRPVATVQALMSLADQRIEDAIARGQFRDLPRGKPIERDHTASSPFVDTTEYFLNKIIQKQEIVPPWIEKQQELIRDAASFRAHLRHEWKRHAARRIAAVGGTLDEQCRRADNYAQAEVRLVRIEARAKAIELGNDPSDAEELDFTGPTEVFRDSDWEKREQAYHELLVKNLNDLTRSYNLIAPELAKKPYISLQRELRRCFADMAGLVAEEIRCRSRIPTKGPGFGNGERTSTAGPTLLEKLGQGEAVAVYDSPEPSYGFKELWRDLFGRRKNA